MEREPKVNIELEWTRPTNTYGELLGYKLRYGIKGQEMFEIMMTENKRRIPDLGKFLLIIYLNKSKIGTM